MQKLEDKDIVFITNHRNTPWLEWCQKSVKKFFPNSSHITIDGSTNWPNVWFEWLSKLQHVDCKYFCMIDEDAFVLNREGIEHALFDMEKNNATIAGVPDAFYEMRGFNEVALNPFFMLGDVKKVLEVIQQPNWRRFIFQERYYDTAKYSWNPLTRQADRRWENYEIFYCFFWAVLEKGHKIHYLFPRVNDDFRNDNHQLPATCVRVTSDTSDIVLHMWYSRQWNDHQNLSRYLKLQTFLNTFL